MVKKIIRFIIDDIKSDVEFLKRVRKGEINLSERVAKLSSISFYSLLKEYWIWYLVLILAFITGWFLASQYYQGVCNSYILENFYTKVNYSLTNFSLEVF